MFCTARPRRYVTIPVLALLAAIAGCTASVIDKEARAQFAREVGDVSITVYPTYVRDRDPHYDAAAADALAEVLRREDIATVVRAADEVPITSEWGMNQARMYRESAQDLARYVKAHPIDTDYAALAEYLMGKDAVGGVHLYVVRSDGTIAFGLGTNSHHDVFRAVDPKTPADATEVLHRDIRQWLAELRPDNQ